MNAKLSIAFLVKRTKITAGGLLPIYLRVTVDGKRFDVSIKRFIEPSKWLSDSGRVKPDSVDSRSINTYLDMLKRQVYDYQTELIQNGKPVTIESIKNKILGIEEKNRSLVKIFQDHNDKVEALLGKEFAPGTLERYKTSLKHTVDFLKWKHKVSDIDVRSVDHTFIADYEFYLRTVRNCNNNSAVKYIKNFGKIIRICLANGWITKNPFKNYKAKVHEVERVFLSEEELQVLFEKDFHNERISLVRDIFLFSCYTGLAYADAKKLDKNQIAIGIDGGKWIFSNRQKTDTKFNIPLLPIAEAIIDKYLDHPQCINQGKLLPLFSNQKMNAYLKEIADLCGIHKPLTYHIARHTFATTVTLTNGVSIESVSKMLGHKNIQTTQHYAKILDRKVSEDMKALKEKFRTKTDFKSSLGG